MHKIRIRRRIAEQRFEMCAVQENRLLPNLGDKDPDGTVDTVRQPQSVASTWPYRMLQVIAVLALDEIDLKASVPATDSACRQHHQAMPGAWAFRSLSPACIQSGTSFQTARK